MTLPARRWVTTHLLTNSAAIRSSACGAQLGRARPLGHVDRRRSSIRLGYVD